MTDDQPPIVPDAVDDAPAADTGSQGEGDGGDVAKPSLIIRIAAMTRAMLDEVRRAPLDEAGRQRLLEVHDRSLAELQGVLSEDLREEFEEIFVPLQGTPSQSELRIAQAQLVGWLEGLFHGIQASLFTQQVAAANQLEEMRKRKALESGEHNPGLYL